VLDIRQRARDLAMQDAQATLSKSTYEKVFGAGACAAGCAAQEAGYRWAAAREIADPADCSGPALPFVAGCRAYAREVQKRGEAAAARAERGG
jgi:hypothetical protein